MMNFYKTPKLDALNEKFNEFENRFQLKLDEQNTAHKIHIQKLDDKIARLEEENSRTFELIDKLYEYRFKEIHDTIAKLSEQMSGKLNHYINIYDNKLENTFTTLQKVMLLTKEKITVIKDKVEICMNDVKNFEEQINTLTKQQEATNEKLVALNNTVSELDDKIDVDVCELYEKIDETINKEIEVMEDKLNENLQDVKDKLDEKINNMEEEINEKIDGLEEKHSLTGELLLDLQNDIILINTHSKLGNKGQQNLNNEILEKIKIITDNVSNIQNINNKFDREIHTLTTRQHITSENVNSLQKHTNYYKVNYKG
jgi:predicted  nucleic acid-binding Zn-ribbon protein